MFSLLIKNIARAGDSEGNQVLLKTEKYCNFSCCPQKYFPHSRKYFSNIPLNPDPRRWRYSPVRHKMFAVTTNASMSQLIAMQTVLHNTLDENHSSIRFELANCGSRILAMSFISLRLAHIVASSILFSAIMWCCWPCIFFMKANHHGNLRFIILPHVMIITWSYDDHLISENKIKKISLLLSSFDIL